jgi:hypothetical protein
MLCKRSEKTRLATAKASLPRNRPDSTGEPPDKHRFIRTRNLPAYDVETIIFICNVYDVGLDFAIA